MLLLCAHGRQVTENVSNVLGDGQDMGWKFGESSKGDFAFTLNGEPMAFFNREGDVWGAKAAGYLMRRSQTALPEGSSELQGGEGSKIASGRWSAGTTVDGNLGFFNAAGDAVALISSDGNIWGAKEGGFFGPDQSAAIDPNSVKPSVSRSNKVCDVVRCAPLFFLFISSL